MRECTAGTDAIPCGSVDGGGVEVQDSSLSMDFISSVKWEAASHGDDNR
jgi:hypothetical protein